MKGGTRRILTAVMTLAYLSVLAPAFSMSRLESASTWIVHAETEEVNDQFIYRGSRLRELVKAKVSYLACAEGQKSTKRYEEFWLREGRPFGLERFQELKIPENDDVAIKLSVKSVVSIKEQEAAADVILRLLLELYDNGNIVTRVIVPAGTLEGIAKAIECKHFTRSKPSNAAKLAVFLQTEDSADCLTLYYAR